MNHRCSLVAACALVGALGVGCSEESAASPDAEVRPERTGPKTPVADARVPDAWDPRAEVNGCRVRTANDLRGMSAIDVGFGDTTGGPNYDPRCATVSVGTTVTFHGDFATDPLVGGTIEGMATMPDPQSVFGEVQKGQTASFTLTGVGPHPFYSGTRGASDGMAGVIFVVAQ